MVAVSGSVLLAGWAFAGAECCIEDRETKNRPAESDGGAAQVDCTYQK